VLKQGNLNPHQNSYWAEHIGTRSIGRPELGWKDIMEELNRLKCSKLVDVMMMMVMTTGENVSPRYLTISSPMLFIFVLGPSVLFSALFSNTLFNAREIISHIVACMSDYRRGLDG
jgi:hypothetical protein